MNIVLFEPEIPPNTGNIIRLCANTNCRLHLIKPLGFSLENKRLRRAGLDYDEFTELDVHENLNAFIKKVKPRNIYGLTTKGSIEYSNINFQTTDTLIFGPETRGLPPDIRESIGKKYLLKIPMAPKSRSINLSNAVAIVLFEALRQTNFSLLKTGKTQ